MQENLASLDKVVPAPHMTMVRHGEPSSSLESILPTINLLENEKVNLRCGSRYMTILKEGILSLEGSCYTSPKLPSTLRDDQDSPQISYFCEQCNDCFQFKSSFDDHMHRRSWILGYLCRICLPTECTHVEDDESICWVCNANMNNKRFSSDRLKIEGTNKMKEMGIVKLFHNQCQFFQHLGAHNSSSIDLMSIMLMPIPIGLDMNEFHQLDRVCAMLMTYLFPRNIHIMDWLKIHKINFDWWRTNEFDKNPIGVLLKKYKETCDGTVKNIKYDNIPFVDCGIGCKRSIPFYNKEAKYSAILAQILPGMKKSNTSSSNSQSESSPEQEKYILSKIIRTCSVQRKNDQMKLPGLDSEVILHGNTKKVNTPNNIYLNRLDSNILPTLSRILKKRSGKIKSMKRLKKPWRIAFNGPNNLILNFNCHLCGETISTKWPTIKSHFDEKHADDYRLSIVRITLTDNSKNIMNMDDIDSKNFLSNKKERNNNNKNNNNNNNNNNDNIGEGSSMKRKRRLHKKLLESSFPSSLGIYIYQEPLKQVEGNFKCKKCDLLFKNVNLLRAHVAKSHRLKKHYFICLECGENFVVAPSLKMHLKAFHGIQDPSAYICENVLCASNIDPEAIAKNTETNHCHVCMAVFENKAAVDKHLRVHGMAFLNHKKIQARQAMEIPVKLLNNEAQQEMEK